MKVLVIEDDSEVVQAVCLTFELRWPGVSIVSTAEGGQGIEMVETESPDLVLMELKLPDMDGFEALRQIRGFSDVPVIIASVWDGELDRVRGLEMGADDYMVKPFNLDELLARIRALLRRAQPARPQVLRFADLSLDTGTRQASRGDRVISLTAKEYELLELFLRHPRQVLTRDVIFDRVWGYDFGGESNIIEVYIRYLRQKLEAEDEPRLLHTVRGMGYVLRETN